MPHRGDGNSEVGGRRVLTVGLILPFSPATAGHPWGVAPTPLVPLAYRQRHGGRRAAQALRAAAGRPDLMLHDLDAGFWEEAPWTAAPPKAFKSLRWQLAQLPVPHEVDVLAAGTRVEQLLALPLGTRAGNLARIVSRAEVYGGQLRRTLSAADLLAYRNAGVMALLELLAVVEGSHGGHPPPAPADVNSASPEQEEQPRDEVVSLPQPLADRDGFDGLVPERVDKVVPMPEPLQALLAAAAEFQGARTLDDALQADLRSLAEKTGLATELRLVELDSVGLAGNEGHTARLLQRIETLQAELTPKAKWILKRRLFRRQPATLARLGEELGVTRERVRQIEQKLKRRIETQFGRPLQIVAGAVAERLAPISRPVDLDRQLGDVFEGCDHTAVPVARRMLRNRLGYRAKGALDLNADAVQAVHVLRSSARELPDDAGLLDEEALRSLLPDPSWTKHWDLLVEACGFHRIDGLLGLRNTKKARVKAAVLNIGRIASREELAARCGLPRQRTVSYLSALPSVARADRTRWGLTEWIDDVYEGVANEILQRIDEDGGATRVERVLEELPRLFGASETTVRAYLAVPQFEVRNGRVCRADPSSLQLRPARRRDRRTGHTGQTVVALSGQGGLLPRLQERGRPAGGDRPRTGLPHRTAASRYGLPSRGTVVR